MREDTVEEKLANELEQMAKEYVAEAQRIQRQVDALGEKIATFLSIAGDLNKKAGELRRSK